MMHGAMAPLVGSSAGCPSWRFPGRPLAWRLQAPRALHWPLRRRPEQPPRWALRRQPRPGLGAGGRG
eukprot:2093143-Pyramimonas_sp.AAC.1